MLAIHLRRGDYREACLSLANWNSTIYGWDLLEFLPDNFIPPSGGVLGKNTPENVEVHMTHCWPNERQVLEKKKHNSRNDYVKSTEEVIDILYILTDDQTECLGRVKSLRKSDGWRVIITNHDLVLDQGGKDVDIAVDMEFAIQAAIFVGNGWSSFTSNIVHRRLVKGILP
ncbi:hypothetical protein NLJ89_g965 [Agrocybe chaxingu]|uniref:Uncharacterized protein n=1 Tax=Agrocybe chaxingu TaxID=84603 RepID=A0A9W8N0U3_9AGAR|nr:hypothetical protein NLJ89_g965 [Agrocybe chaxingu]